MTMAVADWSDKIRLSELGHGPVRRELSPDEAARARLARTLELLELPELQAEVEVAPWLDGATLSGRWNARVVQTCGVTLDPYESRLSGHFSVRVVPEGSPAASSPQGDVGLDPEAEDPPDVLSEDRIDLAAYVVEHLALEIDPYPRKPGVEFEAPPQEAEVSPFAVLKTLKPRDAT